MMFQKPVAIVDIETTGGSALSSRILEIAVLRVEGGQVVEEFQSLVNPGTYVPGFITDITGITTEDVADAPYFEDIAYALREIFSGAAFMAHNVSFDYSFVKRQMEGCGSPFNPPQLCSVKLSRALYKSERGHSLEKLIERHNIAVDSRHRAYDDAKAVFDFLHIARAERGDDLFQAAIRRQQPAL